MFITCDQDNVVNLVYYKTYDQIVDIFMKHLHEVVCKTLRYALA